MWALLTAFAAQSSRRRTRTTSTWSPALARARRWPRPRARSSTPAVPSTRSIPILNWSLARGRIPAERSSRRSARRSLGARARRRRGATPRDRLRERREPAARARRVAPPRARGPPCHRCDRPSPGQPTADRKRGARRTGRCCGTRVRDRGCAAAIHDGAAHGVHVQQCTRQPHLVSLSLISLDARALAVCVVVATLAGLGAGLIPAFAAMRTPLADAMRQGATTQTGFAGLRRLTGRGALVTARSRSRSCCSWPPDSWHEVCRVSSTRRWATGRITC